MHIDIVLAIAIGTLSILMAAIGGVIATEKKVLRFSFVIMGLLSVVLVILQAIRAATSQDALTRSVQQLGASQESLLKAQTELSKAQTDLRDLNTGGDAFPYVEMGGIEDNGLPEGSFISVENHSKTRSLYSVSVEISYREYYSDGRYITHLGFNGGRRLFPEIPPGQSEMISGEFPFKSSQDLYELTIVARNGQFVATIVPKGQYFVSTVKREGSDTVLEEANGKIPWAKQK